LLVGVSHLAQFFWVGALAIAKFNTTFSERSRCTLCLSGIDETEILSGFDKDRIIVLQSGIIGKWFGEIDG